MIITTVYIFWSAIETISVCIFNSLLQFSELPKKVHIYM